MVKIRLLKSEDLRNVVALRRKSFTHSEQSTDATLAAYFEQVFLDGPWSKRGTEAVVCEETDGRIVGFHGRFRKRMLFDGAEGTLVTGTQLMVDPDAGGLVGIQLLQHLFRGDHDLFLADGGNDASRKMWQRLNADVVSVQSLTWTLPIRAHYQLRHLGRSLPARTGRFVARQALVLRDRMVSGTRAVEAHQSGSRVEPVSAQELAPCIHRIAGKKTLVAIHEPDELRWIFDRIEDGLNKALPVNSVFRDDKCRLLGWFSYLPVPGGVGQVLGIGAKNGAYGRVFDALIDDARRRGCDALRGRVESCYLDELGNRDCELARSGPWFLVHSRRADILSAVHRGDSRFNLFDGERWLRF